MRQFLEIKERHPDAIVFFRLGDFYEMFFDDAVLAARQLDLTLTTRDKGNVDAVPMCGVPHHSARGYIAKLVEAGHRVVICEQVEDPKLAKGLVRRDVTRIVTPGVMLDEDVLEPKVARYLAALLPMPSGDAVALAYLDVSTGEFRATEVSQVDLLDELTRVAPREILCAAALRAPSGSLAGLPASFAWSSYHVEPATALALLDDSLVDVPAAAPALLVAAGTVLAYARHTQPAGVLPVARLDVYRSTDSVVLDEAAIANLELIETTIGRKKQGSLLAAIDETVTAPGGRLLRRWLLYPLVAADLIERRLGAVQYFVDDHPLRERVRRALGEVADLERLAGRATLAIATPRDLGKLRDGLVRLPVIAALLGDNLPPLLDPAPLLAQELAALAATLTRMLAEAPPAMLKDGGVIRSGVDAEIDECRRLADGGKEEILAIEIREQAQSGIASLKVRYNRVFGYYIEITKSHLGKVPARYVRKQTVATGERYVTPELAELERKVLSAEETLARREAELFRSLMQTVATQAVHIGEAAAALAVLDVVGGLADVAAKHGYCRPTVDDGVVIDIKDCRHPVIEQILATGEFVPNDCRLDAAHEQLLLITGPNMAGKSTYMRQVAQIVLLAQMGSFVPATACHIGLCDRVFTRVGAADNLSRGDSTFMVEMRETSHILAKATRRSLVILDEVGRGTSTYDGVSLAWAVSEYLHDAIGARTLFATHYHELVGLANSRPRVRNVSAAIRETRGEIVFLRRIVDGGASKSYGIDVARLAGLPRSVIGRARQLLGQLEGGAALGQHAQLSLIAPTATPAAAATASADAALIDELAAVDIDNLTPLAALALLAQLRNTARSTR
ncbi:MAG: DNA mismatch repair protein MutS [Kofleriaceae bacterium]|nr:DNA mismatch repair protein MutS [Kofleriaceae bacterium]